MESNPVEDLTCTDDQWWRLVGISGFVNFASIFCVYQHHSGDRTGGRNGRSLVLTMSLVNKTFFLYCSKYYRDNVGEKTKERKMSELTPQKSC